MNNRGNNLFQETIAAMTPLLVYLLLNMLASTFVTVGWLYSEGIAISDLGDIDMLQQRITEIVGDHYGLISYFTMIATYVIGIPVFGWMFFRDERGRILKLAQTDLEDRRREWISSCFPIPLFCYGIVILGAAATCIAGSNLILLSGIQSEEGSYQLIEQLMNGEAIWLQLLIMGVGAPILEELLFRGLIFRRFHRSGGIISAMFWSSLAFACFHTNMVQGIYAMVIGLMLCYVYYRFRSLLVSVLFHVTVNLSAIFLTGSGLLDFTYSSPVLFLGVTIICMMVIVFCLYEIELVVRPATDIEG